MNQKIAVLGGNSFSGQDFISLLLDRTDCDILSISRSAERSPTFNHYRLHPGAARVTYHQMDFNNDMPRILELLDATKPKWIVNFAAQSEVAPSWEHPEHWFNTNCVALAKLVNHLRKKNYPERYLHISSPEAYGSCSGDVLETTPDCPSTPYAASKSAADMLLSTYQKQYHFPLLTVRATNVYGPGQQLFKIIPRTVISAMSGHRLTLHGGGVAVKSYIHIRDVSCGELNILEKGKIGERYHLSPDHGISVREVVERVAACCGKSFSSVCTVGEERPGQDAAYVINSQKARTELGWHPVIGLGEGIPQVVRWVEKHWDEIQKSSLEYIHLP
ncbi:MAG: GDP-mannose 4,6-dehydratase, partial [Verrucomicrobiae bacterium]|nr:GDP-mannose 4,6-dehydratase [Verrucomicrobiae bacterium]